MNLKIHLFRLTVALLTCVFGIAVYQGVQYIGRRAAAPPPRVAPPVERSFSETQVFGLSNKIEVPKKISEPAAAPEEEWQWDGSGTFYFAAEKAPKGFSDFEFFDIITRDFEKENETGAYGAPVPPEGYVQAGREFKFARISIGNRQIAFETKSVRGVSYKFTGKMRDRDRSSESCPPEEAADLKGRLVKMKNGKKIAETEIGFNAECGC